MKESVVRIPQNKSIDYDFIAFSFNGKHSYEDFGIYRVSDGNGYNESLNPQLSEQTEQLLFGDGLLSLDTRHKAKSFNINFAFDNVNDITLKEIKKS